MPMSRREVLKTGWDVGGGLLAGAAVWTTVEALKPLAGGEGAGLVKLGGGYSEGTTTFVREGRFYLSNVKGTLFALSQTCPHLGCRVPHCSSSGQFECPCHGSKFDLAGEWVSGPSPRGLDRYEVKHDKGGLVVDLGVLVPGPSHGTRTFETPPTGPACAAGESDKA